MKFLKYDEWLSKILKKKSFVLQEKNIIKYLQSHITSKKSFIYTKIKNNKYSSLLKKNKFKYITTNFQSEKKIQKVILNQNNCYDAKKKDLNLIKKLAKDSYRFSRFHLDKRIDKKKCDKIFTLWIENYFNKKRGDYLFINKNKKEITGFLLLKKEKNFFLRIDLIAVKKNLKRKSIGKLLIFHAMNTLNRRFTKLIVGYHTHNVEAKRFYKKLGFKLRLQQDIYHYYR